MEFPPHFKACYQIQVSNLSNSPLEQTPPSWSWLEAVFFQVHVEYSPNLSTPSSQIFEVLYVLVMCLYGLKQLLLLRICVWDDTVAIGTSTDQVLDPLHVSQSETHPLDHDGPRCTTMDRGSARAWLARDVQYRAQRCRVVVIKDFLWELQVLQS